MSFKYRKSTPKKQIVLSVVNKHTLHVKTNKMPTKDLNVIKKAIHVNDKRKSFEMARVDCRTLMTFESRYSIEPVPGHVVRILQRQTDTSFDQSRVPEKLWRTLFPYQKKGIEHALNKFGGRCLLADDMGLGKTRQALAFIGHCHSSTNRVLVACPSYLRYHWHQGIHLI